MAGLLSDCERQSRLLPTSPRPVAPRRKGLADYLSRLKIGIDFDSNYRFVAQQAPNWQGPVLIIDSLHDGIFSQKERDGLRRLYPQAEQHSLIAKGHAASLDQLEQTIVLMRRFLNKHNQ